MLIKPRCSVAAFRADNRYLTELSSKHPIHVAVFFNQCIVLDLTFFVYFEQTVHLFFKVHAQLCIHELCEEISRKRFKVSIKFVRNKIMSSTRKNYIHCTVV